tara:strand:+ start:659 stop:1375 length:717 start_codon:yes stop_codon:yes gene_type:complete
MVKSTDKFYPTSSREVKTVNPHILLLYGPPKIGKTTMLSKLDGCLIVDTEKGSHMIKGLIAEVNSYEEFKSFIAEAYEHRKEWGITERYLAVDTIDKLVDWIEQEIVANHNNEHQQKIEYFGDLAYGKGYAIQRDKITKIINHLEMITKYIIIVGHRKLGSTDEAGLVSPQSLDLTGKLKNMLMSRSDAIGYVFRDDDENLKISFKSDGTLEAGSRCKHLRGKVVDFEWDNIYINEGD